MYRDLWPCWRNTVSHAPLLCAYRIIHCTHHCFRWFRQWISVSSIDLMCKLLIGGATADVCDLLYQHRRHLHSYYIRTVFTMQWVFLLRGVLNWECFYWSLNNHLKCLRIIIFKYSHATIWNFLKRCPVSVANTGHLTLCSKLWNTIWNHDLLIYFRNRFRSVRKCNIIYRELHWNPSVNSYLLFKA